MTCEDRADILTQGSRSCLCDTTPQQTERRRDFQHCREVDRIYRETPKFEESIIPYKSLSKLPSLGTRSESVHD